MNLKDMGVRLWIRFNCLRVLGPVAGFCEHSGEFIDQLSDYQLLKLTLLNLIIFYYTL
jgi:hypothetical protein